MVLFQAVAGDVAEAARRGALDANGQVPERAVSDGDGTPCRHCLTEIPAGHPMLILAHRPFASVQPYAEVGPIFLCAAPCARHPDSPTLPAMFARWPRLLVRGYGAEERIVYGTGRVTEMAELPGYVAALLARDDVARVHLRSASNNCYQARAVRG